MTHMRPKLPLHAMNAGDGPHSYVQNSSYQRGVVDVAKPEIEEEIATKLDIKNLPNRFCIADFGCSTGHNSFPAIQIITEAINQKYKSPKITSESLEFSVFFNDVITNDFDTLFRSLPPDIHYHAAAVPGDFHCRLLPEYSLHFAYSSWSLQWLTAVPEAVADSGSPEWNKGEILYSRDRKEVCDAYLDQFEKDIESFLESRAVEMVSEGLMALLVPAVPDFWNPESEYTIPSDVNLLGSCLVDMAEKVTNIPTTISCVK
ncbi:Loganate O-methyltransferase [Handroanthus impetiginosus]|uniref:Loganate O-methyltransferase n=1 Tax=Handroanthus impetiginosus TaxID=429701 RepID=A0A2G9G596_9LAMI|nr:Loganate O-methyltransferase [Handroanthus impetiginosus]